MDIPVFVFIFRGIIFIDLEMTHEICKLAFFSLIKIKPIDISLDK